MRIRKYKINDLIIGRDFFSKNMNKIYMFFFYIVLLLLVLLFIWLYLGEIDLSIKVTGIVENKNSESLIQNYNIGRVKTNNMVNGKHVNKNDILLELDNESLEYEYNQIKKRINENENFLNFLNNKNYENLLQISHFKISQENLKYKLSNTKLEFEEAKKLYEINKRLFEIGGVSKLELNESAYKCNKLENDINLLKNQIKLLNLNKIHELILEKENYEIQLLKIEEMIKKLKIMAPISGRVEVLKKINVNDVIGKEVVAKIVPESNAYNIKIYIDMEDINKVRLENKVSFNYYDSEGNNIFFYGTLTYISYDYTIYNGKKYYYGICSVDNKYNIYLKNGQQLDGNIVYRKKRILDYLLNIN